MRKKLIFRFIISAIILISCVIVVCIKAGIEKAVYGLIPGIIFGSAPLILGKSKSEEEND